MPAKAPEHTKAIAPITQISNFLEAPKMKLEFNRALSSRAMVDRYIRMTLTSCQKNEKLSQCAPVSVAGALMEAAQLHLMIDGVTGHAYLVPYFNTKKNRYEAHFQIGYKGLVKLVGNSGMVGTFLPNVVYKGDYFDYDIATASVIKHKRTEETEYGRVSHFYSMAQLSNGSRGFVVLTKDEVDHIRDTYSQSYKAAVKYKLNDNTWLNHYEAMGMKTVMRRHAKYLPTSGEIQRAITLDEMAEAGKPQDLGTLVDKQETFTESIETTATTNTQTFADEPPPEAKNSKKDKAGGADIEWPDR